MQLGEVQDAPRDLGRHRLRFGVGCYRPAVHKPRKRRPADECAVRQALAVVVLARHILLKAEIARSVVKRLRRLRIQRLQVGVDVERKTVQEVVRDLLGGERVDAPGAVLRLEDMGVEDYLVSDALVGVIAQRLVKRLCPACKKRGKTNAREMEILGISDPISIARPQGCQFCNNTGYKGRIAVHEIMYMNEDMKNCVSREKNLETLREKAGENGMCSLWDSCRSLVVKGVTSVQELMSLSVE